MSSARALPKTADCVLSYDVEVLGSQVEHGVVGLADARHDERIQKESNAGGTPAAFDVVEDGVLDRIVDTRIRESTGVPGTER